MVQQAPQFQGPALRAGYEPVAIRRHFQGANSTRQRAKDVVRIILTLLPEIAPLEVAQVVRQRGVDGLLGDFVLGLHRHAEVPSVLARRETYPGLGLRPTHYLQPGDTFVDFDHGINIAINKLREALGDSAESPRYIETLARRGYRFIGEAEVVLATAQAAATADASPTAIAAVMADAGDWSGPVTPSGDSTVVPAQRPKAPAKAESPPAEGWKSSKSAQ